MRKGAVMPTTAVTARDWSGPSDVSLMQAVVAARWAVHGPRAGYHVGDMAWWTSMWEWPTPTGPEARQRFWLDRDSGAPVAWAWLAKERELDFAVHPDHDGGGVHELVLGWALEQAGNDLEANALEGDVASVRALEAAKLERAEVLLEQLAMPLTSAVQPDEVAPGYALRPVSGPADLDRRVEIHRTVWHPSRVTATSYQRVMATWPYRSELDWVAVAPDGSFAAYACGWLDEANGAVELEPVGTHPDHRRLGLGRAVCRSVAGAARRLGASLAVVYCHPGGPAQALYEAAGFRRIASRHYWRSPTAG
jgi:GNAT superfamily N-acetyltransferase